MNIANKIASLVALLLIGMGVNNVVGLHQIATVKDELMQVVHRDILLTEAITDIHEKQLKKAILFERLLRIAEELAFEEVVAARRIHLTEHLDITKKGFNKLAMESAGRIAAAKNVLTEAQRISQDFVKTTELRTAFTDLKEIEKAHIKYDTNVNVIMTNVQKENAEISFNDLNSLRKEEKKLSRIVENLLNQVQGYTRVSMEAADKAQKAARKILLYSLYISILLGAIIAFWIIRGIASPLRILVDTTKKIGAGDLGARIKNVSHDEIGHLAEAFNLMAEQLSIAKNELEQKNRALGDALDLTSRQKRDLEKINKELDSFVATVSHDIRAPLTGITGYGMVLRKQYYDKVDKRGQRSIDGIQKGADRMVAMLHDLLELTKISRGKNPYVTIDINDVVDEICDRLEYRIEQNKAVVSIADDLPKMKCDKIKMGVVFFNLINNAIKFSQGDPKIEIGYKKVGEMHEFSVKDNGIGIDPDDQETIFEMFKRGNTAQKYEGTGAGLSFVREIVHEHKGKIWVESTPGNGSTFYFTIAENLA